MIKTLVQIFRTPSAAILAQRELEEAKRQLLAARSAAEFATQMSQYHATRIIRLTLYIKSQEQL